MAVVNGFRVRTEEEIFLMDPPPMPIPRPAAHWTKKICSSCGNLRDMPEDRGTCYMCVSPRRPLPASQDWDREAHGWRFLTNLRGLREERGISKMDLQRRIGYSTKSCEVWRWETLRNRASPGTQKKLARALGCDAVDLWIDTGGCASQGVAV